MGYKKNPFKEARSINEFMLLLREEIERLYRRKLRHFTPSRIWIYEPAMVMHFDLDADHYRCPEMPRWESISWLGILEGGQTHNLPKSHRLYRWNGRDMITSSSGGSGKYKSTNNYSVSIKLKYLPNIARMVTHNQKWADARVASVEDARTLEISKQIAQLSAERTSRQQANIAAFENKNMCYDPFTGKLVRKQRGKKR